MTDKPTGDRDLGCGWIIAIAIVCATLLALAIADRIWPA